MSGTATVIQQLLNADARLERTNRLRFLRLLWILALVPLLSHRVGADEVVEAATANAPAAAEASVAAPAAVPTAVSPAAAVQEMWLVSSRRLPNPCGPRVPAVELDYAQWVDGCWLPSTAEAFWSGSRADCVTCVHVHGNRMTLHDARVGGLDLYRQLRACSESKFRLVVWTWPSDRIHGMARDVFTKMDRADGESYYLASFLAKLPAGGRVSLIGYSFGARTVVGGLHLLAGGTVRGTSLPAEKSDAVRPRVVLLAAALPMGAIVPNGSRSQALAQSESVASFYNAADPALKAFERFGEKSDLLGRHHLSEGCLGGAGAVMLQYNATKTVGKSHDINDYLNSPPLMRAIRGHLLDPGQL